MRPGRLKKKSLNQVIQSLRDSI